MCKHLSPYYLTSRTCLRQVNTIERKNSENHHAGCVDLNNNFQ